MINIPPFQSSVCIKESGPGIDNNKNGSSKKNQAPVEKNFIEVTASAKRKIEPDQALVLISICHCKETAADVKNSVFRRLNYIVQTLKNYGIEERDLCVLKHLTREDNRFTMSAEVKAVFSNFVKCLEAINLLTEKLDKSVHISHPTFSHSFSKLEDLKQEVCLQAVKNARSKAERIACFLQTTIGPPISILEEEYFEGPKIDENNQANSNQKTPPSIQDLLTDATITLECKVMAKFLVC